MITGTATWLTNLAATQKWALYALYFPKFNLYVISFVASKANVTLP